MLFNHITLVLLSANAAAAFVATLPLRLSLTTISTRIAPATSSLILNPPCRPPPLVEHVSLTLHRYPTPQTEHPRPSIPPLYPLPLSMDITHQQPHPFPPISHLIPPPFTLTPPPVPTNPILHQHYQPNLTIALITPYQPLLHHPRNANVLESNVAASMTPPLIIAYPASFAHEHAQPFYQPLLSALHQSHPTHLRFAYSFKTPNHLFHPHPSPPHPRFWKRLRDPS